MLMGATPTSDRRCKAAAHSYCTRSSQHLCVPGFILARVGHRVSLGSAAGLSPQILGFSSYLIDTPKEGEELAEKGGAHAGNVNEGPLEVGGGCE